MLPFRLKIEKYIRRKLFVNGLASEKDKETNLTPNK